MKLSKKKIILILLAVAAVVLGASVVFTFIKDRTYFHSPPYTSEKGMKSDVLVAYYSRSGSTEAMAREIARKLNSDILRIEAKSYTLDLSGWYNAVEDARKKNKTKISPEKADLSSYRLIFLGSPIWLFRPAPPLWTFVDKNDFKDKKVILFNTFNSRFKDEEIKEFQREIESRGGKFADHVYVRRGRIYNQKTGKELILEAQALVNTKAAEWTEQKEPGQSEDTEDVQ